MRNCKRAHSESIANKAFTGTADDLWSQMEPLYISGKAVKSGARSLPALMDEEGQMLTTNTDIANRWLSHHAHVECGVVMTNEQIVKQAQKRHWADTPGTGTKEGTRFVASRSELGHVFFSCKTGRSAGNDGVPAEIRPDAPTFAKLAHAPALKTTLCNAEPIQFKGVSMFKISKGKGDHLHTEHWRGVLLADILGKNLRRMQRGWLMPFAIPAIGLQFGGMPGKGTDMAAHMVRLLQEFAHIKKHFDCHLALRLCGSILQPNETASVRAR